MFLDMINAIRSVWNNPLCADNRIALLARFFSWHIGGRLVPGKIAVEWVNGARFLASPFQSGLSAYAYSGLYDFEDMSFLLHFLKPGDLFVDIGANCGSYTILASGAVGAKSIAIEPVPDTFSALLESCSLDNMPKLVRCHNVGIGEREAVLTFSDGAFEGLNHVVVEDENPEKTVEVSVKRLDDLLADENPTMLKIDVEGYEKFVLKGAEKTLNMNLLKAIIIEMNNSGERYGVQDEEIDRILSLNDFSSVKYDPFERTLEPCMYSEINSGNAIYVRGIKEAEDILKKAKPYSVFNKTI